MPEHGKIPPKESFRHDTLVTKLLEELAKLEHDQWIDDSKDVASRIGNASSLELLLSDTEKKWSTKWIDYSLLSESDKDKDRIWAKRVLETLRANKESLRSILAVDC